MATLPIDWDLAGISVERPLQIGKWGVPARIELSEQKLSWQWYREGTEPHFVKAERDLLNRFVGLSSALDADILKFARTWGMLMICGQHGWPASHHPSSPPTLGNLGRCLLLGEGTAEGCYDPLQTWRLYSQQARAMLNLAAAVHQGNVGQTQDWCTLYGWKENEWPAKPPWTSKSLTPARFLLAQRVEDWLILANFRTHFAWFEETPFVELAAGGLFGALAFQLVLAISRAEGLAFCSSCRFSYVPTRRPAVGRRNYCPQCGRRAALRDAQRTFQKKKKKRF